MQGLLRSAREPWRASTGGGTYCGCSLDRSSQQGRGSVLSRDRSGHRSSTGRVSGIPSHKTLPGKLRKKERLHYCTHFPLTKEFFLQKTPPTPAMKETLTARQGRATPGAPTCPSSPAWENGGMNTHAPPSKEEMPLSSDAAALRGDPACRLTKPGVLKLGRCTEPHGLTINVCKGGETGGPPLLREELNQEGERSQGAAFSLGYSRRSQKVPLQPGVHVQAPLTWSQAAPWSHWHWWRQAGPNHPSEHS